MRTMVKRVIKAKTFYKEFLAMTLAILMVILLVPENVVAELSVDSKASMEDAGKDPQGAKRKDADVYDAIGEIIALRESDVKHVRMSDGTFCAVKYPEEVHFRAPDNTWVEYDNTLVFTPSTPGSEAFYSPIQNDLDIKFSADNASGHLFCLKYKGYAIQLNALNQTNSVVLAKTSKQQQFCGAESNFDAITKLSSFAASVTYPNLFDKTDVDYHLAGGCVKENIVIKERLAQGYTYLFSLNLVGLSASLEEETGNIYLTNDKGEGIFVIPAGYMYDAANAYSDDVTYTLKEYKKGEYIVAINASEDWINDEKRVFPITVDPTLIRTNSTLLSNIKDAYVIERYPDLLTGEYAWMYTGYYDGMEDISLVGIRTLPVLSASSVIIKAGLGLRTYDDTSTNIVNVGAYEVLQDWEAGTVTWNTRPSCGSTLIDYISAQGIGTYTFDITSLAQKWYSNPTSYPSARGVALVALNGDAEIVKFSTVNNTIYNANYPIFTVSYRDNKGLEDRWTYHTQYIGENATGHVNDFSGNLVMDVGLGLDVGGFPVYAASVFNTYLVNAEFFTAHKNRSTSISSMKYGCGWQLSLMQTLVAEGDNYCYTDADGTDHYFVLEDGEYIDEDGLGYAVAATGGYLRLTTPDGACIDFYTGTYAGAIYRVITDSETYTYHYTTSTGTRKLTSVTDSGSNIILSFTYSSDYLASITDMGNNTALFTYTSGTLTGITCGDGSSYTITYGTTIKTLSKIKDNASNYAMNYSFTSSNGIYRVSFMTESYNGNNCNDISIFYPSLKTTVFVTPGADDDPVYNSDNLKTVYQFDNFGRTVNAYTTNFYDNVLYDATMLSYQASDVSTTELGQNNVQTLASSGSGAVNLLRNSSVESSSYWTTITYGSSVTGSRARTSADKFIGAYSLKVNPTASNTSYYGYYQSVSLAAGTYTLSAYVKTTSVISSIAGGATIGIFKSLTSNALPSDISEKIAGTTNADLQSGWRRISVTFTLTATTTVYTFLGTYASTGTAYFDCIQLEKGSAYNDYNLIDNPSFEMTNEEWALTNVTWNNGGTGLISAKALTFAGSYTAAKSVSQTVTLDMAAGNTFVVSGWVKASSLPLPENNPTRKFAIKVFINYATAADETLYYSFNPANTGWQYVCASVVPAENDAITSVTVSFDYGYNGNGVLLDNLTLTAGGVSSFYDNTAEEGEGEEEEGGLLPVEGTTDQKYQIIDDIKYTYTYDSNDNIIATVIEYTGTSGINFNDKFYTSSTYNSEGAMLTNTDELGHTTSYSYTGGLLSSVTDAKNRTTHYTYNTDKLLTKLYQTVGSQQVANNYTYNDNGALTGVTHTLDIYTTLERYSFTYNIYGDLVSIYQGDTSTGTALVTYAYNPFHGKLISATYANGFVESYAYDALDRLSSVSHNGTVKYSYKYDAKGVLLETVDTVNATTEKYEYDLKENFIRKYQVSAASKSILFSYEPTLDIDGQLTGYQYIYLSGVTNGYEAIYNDAGQLIRENLSSGEYIEHTYDVFGREFSTLVFKTDGNLLFGSANYYAAGSGGANASSYNVYQVSNSDIIDFEYTYDDVGNIVLITSNSNAVASYEYDDLNQLVRENNAVSGETYVYMYDASGNITYKFIIDYDATTPTNYLPLAAGTIIPYTYGNSANKDLLTSYNGTSISYDNLGNPTNWRNATNITWNGRQLTGYSLSQNEYLTYKYNADGLRTQKYYINYNEFYLLQHDYYLDGATITGEKIYMDSMNNGSYIKYQYYYYDADGSPIGINYNGVDYYYRKNLLGDIEYIYSEAGWKVVGYTYDAWGNTTSITGTMASTLGADNPFRYRGYYYDTETGLYYLQSRYYDPLVGRFLNADEPILLGASGSLISNNLYAYCGNNPVMFLDSSGHFGTPIQWLCAFIGSYVGWRIGDWVARKMGLFDGKWWQWQTYAYWTVRGFVVAGGAILGWVAGTALLGYLKGYLAANTAVLTKFPLPIQKFVMWFLGMGGSKVADYLTELFNRYGPSHIFSKQHIADGIMKLGGTQRQIFDKIMNVVTLKMPQAATGSNQIHTTINGVKVTIRFFVKDGAIQSVDAFVGWAERIIGKLLK